MLLCIFNFRQSLSLTESLSSYITRFDLGSIWNFAANNSEPPLYYLALKGWAHFLGHTDFVMRMFSAVAGAATILFTFLWLKYKYGLKAATIAGFLLSISPAFVHYGQEMTMVCFVAAIVSAATYFLQLAIDNGERKWWIIYTFLMIAGLWTSQYVALAWCAHLVYLVMIFGKKIWKKKIWLPYLVATITFIPVVVKLLKAPAVQSTATDISTPISFLSETIYYMNPGELQGWILVLAILTIIAIAVAAIRYRKKTSLLLSMILAPVVLLMVLSMMSSNINFEPKHIVFAMLSIPVLAGIDITFLLNERINKRKKIAFWKRPKIIAVYIGFLVICSSIVGIVSTYAKGNYGLDSGTRATNRDLYNAIMDANYDRDLPIVVNSPQLFLELSSYTSEYHPILFIDEMAKYDDAKLAILKDSYFGKINDFDGWLNEHSSFWYVGVAPENPYKDNLATPRKNLRATEIINQQFDEHGDIYQILKLERE